MHTRICQKCMDKYTNVSKFIKYFKHDMISKKNTNTTQIHEFTYLILRMDMYIIVSKGMDVSHNIRVF